MICALVKDTTCACLVSVSKQQIKLSHGLPIHPSLSKVLEQGEERQKRLE